MNAHHISTEDYHGPERRVPPLSEEQIEDIAERAAERAVQKMKAAAYQGIGQAIVSKMLWLTGIAAVWLYWWLLKNGFIKP